MLLEIVVQFNGSKAQRFCGTLSADMNQPVLEDQKRHAHTVARELADNTGYLLASLGAACKAQVLARAEEQGFELYDYTILALLGEGARATQATIAETMMIDPSRLVALLDSLEQRGLIARQRDPDDRRRHVVSITGAGQGELVKLRGWTNQVCDEFFAPLTALERATLHRSLVTLAAQNDPRCCPFDELEASD